MMRPRVIIALAIMTVSCRATRDRQQSLDDHVAIQRALDSFPTIAGRMAIVRGTHNRGDTVRVQLAPVELPGLGPASDSTLFVWITRPATIVRTQWARESRNPIVIFTKHSP